MSLPSCLSTDAVLERLVAELAALKKTVAKLQATVRRLEQAAAPVPDAAARDVAQSHYAPYVYQHDGSHK